MLSRREPGQKCHPAVGLGHPASSQHQCRMRAAAQGSGQAEDHVRAPAGAPQGGGGHHSTQPALSLALGYKKTAA